MAKRKAVDPPKPEAAAPISLRRVEERVERVPITDAQRAERMAAAAAKIHEANVYDGEIVELKEQLKLTKQRAGAKHEEAEQIILDAQNGTMAAPFPVIVERHPTRPAEMLVWRVPDGVPAEDVLSEVLAEVNVDHQAAREAQGCVLIETRAMSSDEVVQAQKDDMPELPKMDPPQPTGDHVDIALTGDARVHVARVEKLDLLSDDKQQWFCTLVEDGEVFAAGATREEAIDNLTRELPAILASREAKKAASSEEVADSSASNEAEKEDTSSSKAVACPFITEESKVDAHLDEICGKPGVKRHRGFCEEHVEKIGKGKLHGPVVTHILARKTRRQHLAQIAAEQQAQPSEQAAEV